MPANPHATQAAITTNMILRQLAANNDKEPECATKLASAGSEARALWQSDLNDYDYAVWQYRQTHPWYVPVLSKWVEPTTWMDISEDLLHPDDQTDGGPPNSIAVESFLRQEGRYTTGNERGKVHHSNTVKELQSIKWVVKETHTRSFEAYVKEWKKYTRTMYERQKPPQEMQCKIMVEAVQPVTM